jgi:glyoxylase-like metal-dependent hydrolase (beta-lactamase superfamily II)/rhodanese-related sulfurtransferase
VVFEQFYLGCLAHASYLIGSDGVAAVVDPQRDVDIYLEAAKERGLRIAHIIETHLHADFVSGHQELAGRTGAAIYLGEDSGAEFPHRAVGDGDEIAFGQCRLRFLQTPGHTLESVSVVVFDREQGEEPVAVLTGDTLFIGDVGRPDLSDQFTPQQLAGKLYDSLHGKLLGLPDTVKVYPAHGAGSMCGRNISADRNSTIGRERATNYALQPMSRERFIEIMTHDLPARPEYFQRDVAANRQGAPALDSLQPVPRLSPAEVLRRQQEGATVLDVRPAAEFCSGAVPGSLQIGLSGQFASWAATLLGLDRDIILVAEDDKTVDEARMRLARVGIEHIIGSLADGVAGWTRAGLSLAEIEQITVQDLRAEMDRNADLAVVDVRRPTEWEQGHIPRAVLHPLDQLRTSLESLDRRKLTAVHCKSGYRSLIACSLLAAHGFKVMNVLGGYDAWAAQAGAA